MSGVFQTTYFQNSTGAIGSTQDLTIPGFGTPQAVIFIPSRAFGLGGTWTDKSLGFGFTDGVTSYFQGSFGRHNAMTSETCRYQDLANPLAILDRNRVTRGKFAFNSWVTDGIRLEVVEAASNAYYMGAIFLKGFDYATVAQHVFPAGVPSSLVLTGNAGAPNIGFYVSGDRTNSSGIDSNGRHSFGIVTDEGAIVQRCVAEFSADSATTMDTWQYINQAHAVACGAGGKTAWEIAVTDYTVDGSGDGQIDFEAGTEGSQGIVVGVLALKAPAGDDFKLLDTIAHTANYTESGVGFESDFAMVMTGNGWTAHSQELESGNINAWGVSAFEAIAGFTSSSNDRDGSTQSSCRNTFATDFEFIEFDGTNDCRGPIPTFDANGWSTTWQFSPAADRYGWALAYAAGTAPPGITPANATQAQRAEAAALVQAHILAPDNATQAQRAAIASLLQAHVLAADGATQAQRTEAAPLVTPEPDTYALVFGGDTYIDIPGVGLDNSLPNRLTYTIRADSLPLARQDVWASYPDNDNHGGVRSDGLFRGLRADIGGNLNGVSLVPGVLYNIEEDVPVAGTLNVTADNGGGSDTETVGTTGIYTAFRIGGSFGTNRWRGIIRDVRSYDEFGTLIHHWRISDNVPDGGEITDLVGGAHGTLTLGSGYWIGWPGYVFDPDDTTQAQRAQEVVLGQAQFLIPADAVQAQRAEAAALTIGDMIVPADAFQAQLADEAGTVQFHVLNVDNATQAQIADVAILGGFVIGNLGGELVAYTLVDGVLTAKSLYSGQTHTVH